MARLVFLVFFLCLRLQAQQDPVQALPPSVRAMLPGFHPPAGQIASIESHFTADSVYVGQQVELVEATWFDRDILSILRRQPSLTTPSLSGLWSTRSARLPALTLTRAVAGRSYALYLTHQTLFPLNATTLTAPAPQLRYSMPLNNSFFAPEEPRTLTAKPPSLVVLPIPAALVAALGDGPTAQELRLRWRGPSAGIKAGVAAPLELVLSGYGNVTLWPEPTIQWPDGLRVYPEPARETFGNGVPHAGGEKRFRYTVVAEQDGVISLPVVRYPYFDPVRVAVTEARTPAVSLPVFPGPRAGSTSLQTLRQDESVPWAVKLTQRARWWLIVIAVSPVLALLLKRRGRAESPVTEPSPRDPAEELRLLLAASPNQGAEDITLALRRRGVSRNDAVLVQQWLLQREEDRYGRDPKGGVKPPDAVAGVLRQLRKPSLLIFWLILSVNSLRAQESGRSRYLEGDYQAAARLFAEEVQRQPLAPGLWQNLAAAENQAGDPVGAAVALLQGLSLAPRDGELRSAWRQIQGVPADVMELAPRLPLNLSELVLLSLLFWLAATVCWSIRRRRLAGVMLAVTLIISLSAIVRYKAASLPQLLVRRNAQLLISPASGTPEVGLVSQWGRVRPLQRVRGWYLVHSNSGGTGWLREADVAVLGEVLPVSGD